MDRTRETMQILDRVLIVTVNYNLSEFIQIDIIVILRGIYPPSKKHVA